MTIRLVSLQLLLDELLSTGGTSADLAVTALVSFDFHRDGRQGPEHRFSPAARRKLLARCPDSVTNIDGVLRWTLAAAAASLDDALPEFLISPATRTVRARTLWPPTDTGSCTARPSPTCSLRSVGWAGNSAMCTSSSVDWIRMVVTAVSTQELHQEMEWVAEVLAKKGIEASWLTDALAEAERITSDKARKSQEIF
jgi:hypothetical protein